MSSELSKDMRFEVNGFMEAISASDFPIRNRKVILKYATGDGRMSRQAKRQPST